LKGRRCDEHESVPIYTVIMFTCGKNDAASLLLRIVGVFLHHGIYLFGCGPMIVQDLDVSAVVLTRMAKGHRHL
jgi:hypothetical protein